MDSYRAWIYSIPIPVGGHQDAFRGILRLETVFHRGEIHEEMWCEPLWVHEELRTVAAVALKTRIKNMFLLVFVVKADPFFEKFTS